MAQLLTGRRLHYVNTYQDACDEDSLVDFPVFRKARDRTVQKLIDPQCTGRDEEIDCDLKMNAECKHKTISPVHDARGTDPLEGLPPIDLYLR